MARTTTKKKSIGSAKSTDIASFFRKTPSDTSVPRRHNSISYGNGNGHEDIKPGVGASKGVNNRSVVNGDRKGKGKATAISGESSTDPVVISDDDDGDDRLVSEPRSAVKRQRRSSPSPPLASFLPQSPGAGPSRRPVLTCSPPPELDLDPTPVEIKELPPPIASVPDFRPPPSWPTIINTADIEEPEGRAEEDGVVDVDYDDVDKDSQHPSMFDESELQDGEEEPPDDTGQAEPEEVIDVEGVGVGDPDEITEIPPDSDGHGNGDTGRIAGTAQTFDLSMEWDEGDDEGMGMEEPDEFDNERLSRNGKKAGGTLKRPKSAHSITSINHSFSPGPSTPSPEPETPIKGPNAFSVLMSGHKERAQWKDVEDDLRRDQKRTIGRRKAPFYKVCRIARLYL